MPWPGAPAGRAVRGRLTPPSDDFVRVPKERRAATVPADRGLLPALPAAGRRRPRRDPRDQPHRPRQPVPAQAADRRRHRRRAVRQAQPVRRADDRAAGPHGADRRGPGVPQQRHRPERDAGPAQRALRPSPADAAAVLHRHPDGRDPEPARQRRRRRAGGRHGHRGVDHVQRRRRDLHDARDVPALLAAHAASRSGSCRSSSTSPTASARSGARSAARPRSGSPT